MNRIDKVFQQGKVFAAYITAGDGTQAYQLEMIGSLIAGGVNLLEIGVPFSDPIADGLVIQRAMHRSLSRGTTMQDVIDLIAAIRQHFDIPIIVFTYYNPIISSKKPILAQFKEVGADGILVVDLPFTEAEQHLELCSQLDLYPIAVLSPSTDEVRLQSIIKHARGFLYYACQRGTTGVRESLPTDLASQMTTIKAHTDIPVIVGFGIADRIASQHASSVADGFVVGSYFIQAMEQGCTAAELLAIAKPLQTPQRLGK